MYHTKYYWDMRNVLSFNNCTIGVSDSVISSTKAARRLFMKDGFRGTIELCRVINSEGQEMACWVCRHGERVVRIMPVIRKEPCLPVGQRYGLQKMTGNELFGYQNTFFRTYTNGVGEIGIRAVLLFADEELVRAACRARGYNVVTVTPVKVLDAKTREYLSAAWCVRCMDCSTDFALTFMDLRDGLKLEGFDLLNDAVYQNLKVGENFKAYDKYYQLRKRRATNEWYVDYSPLQIAKRA